MLRRTNVFRLARSIRGIKRVVLGQTIPAAIAQSFKSDKEIIIQSRLFNKDWYLLRYGDVAASRADPLDHYIRDGVREGRYPNPLFDGNWYLERYPDVAAARMNPLVHYAQYGCREGRDPHPGFSTLYYLDKNPDVADSGLNALAHYLLVGSAAGRRAFDPNARYRRQVLKEQQQLAVEMPHLLQHVNVMLYKPIFHVFICGNDAGERADTRASVERQIYEDFIIYEFDWLATKRPEIKADDQSYLVFLRSSDLLGERALYEFANAINANPAIEIAYADEDRLEDGGARSTPFYKPDWSPDTLESLNYFGSAASFRADLATSVWADARSYFDFVLRATELASQIEHIRAVICHRRHGAADPILPEESEADVSALLGRLERTGRVGTVAPTIKSYACYDVTVKSPAPRISVIIPTAGQVVDLDGHRVDLILNCLDSIERISTYKNLEFVVVDNGDLGDKRLKDLQARGCQIVTFGETKFNVSKKLNLGASNANGELLLLLNDDSQPRTTDWIERLLEHFEKPGVGVVGAKLLYPDLTLQHAGVATNKGNPEHIRRMYPHNDRGYFFSTCSARDYSAVTGACMMVRAEVYRRLGGYNEALAISYNDVDFCFKIREAGLTVVYAPRAQLIHFESQSRKPILDLAESEYFHTRWASMLTSDPYYNEENLEILPGSFEVDHNPRWL